MIANKIKNINISNLNQDNISDKHSISFPNLKSLRERTSYFGGLLSLILIFDGILTFLGVNQFGIQMEGNPFLRDLMYRYGPEVTLIFSKSVSILIIAGLLAFASSFPWIRNAIKTISYLYMMMAILPWTYILVVKPLLF